MGSETTTPDTIRAIAARAALNALKWAQAKDGADAGDVYQLEATASKAIKQMGDVMVDVAIKRPHLSEPVAWQCRADAIEVRVDLRGHVRARAFGVELVARHPQFGPIVI